MQGTPAVAYRSSVLCVCVGGLPPLKLHATWGNAVLFYVFAAVLIVTHSWRRLGAGPML